MVKKTKLEINNSFIEIYCSDDKVMDGLRKQSSYKPPSVYFSAAVKKKKWSGVSYLARKTSYGLQMPTGLLSRCLKFLDENKFPYAVVDSRKKPKKVNHGLKWNEAKIPFYYQAEAVEAALKAGRGMISIGTGGGKMLLASHLYFRTGVRTLILVTSREAVADTVKELKELIPGVDVAAWPNRKKITATVTVATVNAFHDRHLAKNPILKECLNKTQLLIMDEAHGVGAKEYFGISKKCNAYYKFGQSGTAFRTDKKDIFLVAASGEILYNKPASELQSEGFLTESRIIFLKTDPPNVDMYDLARYTDNDFYDATIVRNEARNNLPPPDNDLSV
jgi:superfamily II DNA or RNA helicase